MGRKLLKQLDESDYDPNADGYVYRFAVQRKDQQDPCDGVRLYVGQTVNIRKRMSNHDDAGEGIEFWDEENQVYRTDIPYEVSDRGHILVRNFYKENHDQPIKKVLKAKERQMKRQMERDDRNRPPIVGGGNSFHRGTERGVFGLH